MAKKTTTKKTEENKETKKTTKPKTVKKSLAQWVKGTTIPDGQMRYMLVDAGLLQAYEDEVIGLEPTMLTEKQFRTKVLRRK